MVSNNIKNTIPIKKASFPTDRQAGAKGAGEKFRLRLADNMCVKCHPMRDLSKYPETTLMTEFGKLFC
jgi:hypothetical protein